MPYSYTLEGDVEDVSRQHIANRTSARRAPGAVVHRHQADAAISTSRRTASRPSWSRSGSTAQPVAGHPDRRHPDADPVAQRAPRRRQRLLHLGHGAQGSAVGRMAPDDRGRSGGRSPCRCRPAATSSSRRDAEADRGRFAVTRDSFYALGERLHRVGALRSQPHRSRAGAHDLQAGRDRAHHDPVAVGTGDGARHHRARRRSARTGSSR